MYSACYRHCILPKKQKLNFIFKYLINRTKSHGHQYGYELRGVHCVTLFSCFVSIQSLGSLQYRHTCYTDAGAINRKRSCYVIIFYQYTTQKLLVTARDWLLKPTWISYCLKHSVHLVEVETSA